MVGDLVALARTFSSGKANCIERHLASFQESGKLVPVQMPSPRSTLFQLGDRFIRRLARGDKVTALVDQAIVSSVNLLTTIIIGRACGKEQLGLFAAGISIVMIAYTAQTALVLMPYVVSYPRLSNEDRRSYNGSVLLHQLGFLMLLVGSLITLGWAFVNSSGGRELGGLLLTIAVPVSFIVFREFARQISCAERRFRQALFVDFGAGTLQLAGLSTLAYHGSLDAGRAFIVAGFSCGLSGLGWLAYRWATFEASIRNAWRDLSRNWFFGRWLFGSGLLREMSVSVYPWIIIGVRGAGEAGLWASCVGVVALNNPIMLALYNEAGPRISHSFAASGIKGLRREVLRTTKICCLAALPILLLLVIYGDELVVLIYGEKFAGGSITIALLAASAFLVGAGFSFPYGLLALERPGLDFLGNAASFLVLVLLGWWCTLSFGTSGAAFGVLLATAIGVAFKAGGFARVLRRREEAMFD